MLGSTNIFFFLKCHVVNKKNGVKQKARKVKSFFFFFLKRTDVVRRLYEMIFPPSMFLEFYYFVTPRRFMLTCKATNAAQS